MKFTAQQLERYLGQINYYHSVIKDFERVNGIYAADGNYLNYSGIRYGNFGKSYTGENTQESFAISRAAVSEHLQQRYLYCQSMLRLLESGFRQLNKAQQEVLAKVCIEHWSAQQAALLLNMDRSTVYRIKKAGLKELETLVNME